MVVGNGLLALAVSLGENEDVLSTYGTAAYTSRAEPKTLREFALAGQLKKLILW